MFLKLAYGGGGAGADACVENRFLGGKECCGWRKAFVDGAEFDIDVDPDPEAEADGAGALDWVAAACGAVGERRGVGVAREESENRSRGIR